MVAIEWFKGCRTELGDLFALADDSPVQVARYRDLGRILVARDGPVVAGHLQLVVAEDGSEAEVKSIAVREDRQGAATLSTAMNSNALNVTLGFLLPSALIGIGTASASATLVAGAYLGVTLLAPAPPTPAVV